MRIAGGVACAIIGLECFERALGATPQTLLAPNAIWLWYIVGVYWCWIALRFFFDPKVAT